MHQNDGKWSRRDFLKATGTAGLGTVLAPVSQIANATEAKKTIPARPFGKTGAKVSILSLEEMGLISLMDGTNQEAKAPYCLIPPYFLIESNSELFQTSIK